MALSHHVDVANHNFLIELLTAAAVNQVRLAVVRQFRLVEVATNFFFLDAVEHRRGELHTEQLCRPAKVRFQHLSDVHARGHAQRIQHDVHRRSVLKEWHVFFGNDLGDDTFITVASGHLVTNRQFAFRGNVNFH